MSTQKQHNRLDKIEQQSAPVPSFPTAIIFEGETERAGTALHAGDAISADDLKERLDEYRQQYGEPPGMVAIKLNVHRTDPRPFEQEIRCTGTN